MNNNTRVYAMFMRPKSPHGRIASHFFGHPGFQHCEFYFPDSDETFATMQTLISFVSANASRLDRYGARTGGGGNDAEGFVWAAVPLNALSEQAAERLRSECGALTGRMYNYGGLLTHILGTLGRIKYPPGSLFCSEALALALHNAGIVDIRKYGFSSAAACRPSDVFRMCLPLTCAEDTGNSFTDPLLGITNATDREAQVLEASDRLITNEFSH